MPTYRIADLRVEMHTWGRTFRQAEPYRVADRAAELVISSEPEALQKRCPQLTLDECEYLSTGACFYRALTRFGGMMLHSSCVVVDDRAYLFTAPCGMGKSTHTRLWLELFGERAYILNDDKPALRVLSGRVYVYGTPWSGKDDKSRNERVPLGGIAVLARAQKNAIEKLKPTEAVFSLLDQTVRSDCTEEMNACIDTLNTIVSTGKIWKLLCNTDISAARLSYEAMKEENI